MSSKTLPGVAFTPGQTGSTLFREALAGACEHFPEVFGDLSIPEDPSAFKRELSDLLVRFEARRAGSERRIEIARMLSAVISDHARFAGDGADGSLSDHLDGAPAPDGPATEQQGTAEAGWVPQLDYRGETYRGARFGELADRMRADHQLTESAAAALRWVATELLGAPLVLSDHCFALLGAAAELSPAPYLLAAGARVVWIDRQAPSLAPEAFAGTLVHPAQANDLLADPGSAYRAVLQEAERGPVHLGLYAYAPGKGRELLLTTSMNAIAGALPADALRSVSMLISPTTPGEVQPEDRRDREARRSTAPRWQRALARTPLLPDRAHHRHGEVEIARSIVPMQGPTYLAAQYLTKMMLAESWAIDRAPLRISANVAGITHTRSLEHPLFLAGFLGAPLFGIEIFQPDNTRVLTTLLMLHDVLNPDAPGADASDGPVAQARRLVSQTVHGGLRSAPFDFDRTIRVAAVLGLVKKPSLLLRLRS